MIPESQLNVENWLRDMVANLSVFPTTITMFLLGKIFMDAFTGVGKGQLFVPPLIGNPGDPNALSSIIGMTIILMTPGVVTMMRDLLKAPGFKYTAEAGKSLSAGLSPVQRYGNNTFNEYFGVHGGHGAAAHGGFKGSVIRILGLGGHG